MSVCNASYSSTSSVDLNKLSPIQVFVRIKPNNSNDQSEMIPFEYSNNYTILTLSNSPALSFNNVFPPQSTQSDIFESMIPLLHLPLYGYNSTIFAYGQTNSGKRKLFENDDIICYFSLLDKLRLTAVDKKASVTADLCSCLKTYPALKKSFYFYEWTKMCETLVRDSQTENRK
jgi:hypothetical protein